MLTQDKSDGTYKQKKINMQKIKEIYQKSAPCLTPGASNSPENTKSPNRFDNVSCLA